VKMTIVNFMNVLKKIAPVKFSIPKGSLEEATFNLLEESWT